MEELEQKRMIDSMNSAVVEVIKDANSYEEFIYKMKQRGYVSGENGFRSMNNFHQYFDKEGPFWTSFLLAKHQGKTQEVTAVTRDNLRGIVELLLEQEVLKRSADTERKLIALQIVEEQKSAHPVLSEVSWEECYERAVKRETEVANLMYKCMQILITEHGFEYSRDIEG